MRIHSPPFTGVNYPGVQNHICRVFDPAASPEEEAAELCRVCTEVIAAANPARPANSANSAHSAQSAHAAHSAGRPGEVVLVHGSDLDAVALVCMAHLVVNEGVAPTMAEAQGENNVQCWAKKVHPRLREFVTQVEAEVCLYVCLCFQGGTPWDVIKNLMVYHKKKTACAVNSKKRITKFLPLQ